MRPGQAARIASTSAAHVDGAGSILASPSRTKTARASMSSCRPCRSTARSCAVKSPTRRKTTRAHSRAVKVLATIRRAPAMSTEKIRLLNDAFRTTLAGGKVVLTAGVNALPSDVKAAVIQRVMTFSDFNEENDPHQEHDFGNFTLAGRKFFFKLDYYDSNMEFGSEDPSDPSKTTRVLTIMLAEEY